MLNYQRVTPIAMVCDRYHELVNGCFLWDIYTSTSGPHETGRRGFWLDELVWVWGQVSCEET